jgi:hypothetical protein
MRLSFCALVASVLLYLASSCALAEDVSLPTLANGKVVVDLDEPYSRFCAAGDGRYLIFHLKQSKKLLLFDIFQAAVTKTIDCPGEDIMLAGGKEKLIVVVPAQMLAHCYSVPGLVREKSVPLGNMPVPKYVLLGCCSKGPLIFWGGGPVVFWDLNRLSPIAMRGEVPSGDAMYNHMMSISADGQTFCFWLEGISGQRFNAYHIAGNTLTHLVTPGDYSHAGRWLKPNADGSFFIRDGTELFSANLKPIASERFAGLAMQPTEDPRFFVAATFPQGKLGEDVWICSFGGLDKIFNVKDVGSLRYNSSGNEDGHQALQSRMRYFPDRGLLVTLPGNDRQIRVLVADVKSHFAAHDADYLFVISLPPVTAVVGKPYSYQLETLTNAKKVTFNLESGPDGMTVDARGQVQWTPKSRPAGSVEHIVLAARSDNGREAFQSFEVSIERGSSVPAIISTGKADSTKAAAHPFPQPATSRPQAPKQDNRPKETPPDKAASQQKPESHPLELPSGEYSLVPGLKCQSMLLLQGDQLTELGPDGITPQNTIALPKRYVRIAERADYWVAVSEKPFTVDLLQKETFGRTATRYHDYKLNKWIHKYETIEIRPSGILSS